MPLSPMGWGIMLVALACVWGLVIWSYHRILTAPQEDDVPPPPAGFGA
ncbi:MAG: hypothetical protein R2882_11140 [Gemmatimonadales bacterium]